jgi:glycosyltransferase XagB
VIPQLIKAMRHNTSGRLALTTPTHFFELVRAAARRQITRRASLGLVSFDPTLSAKGGLTRRQKYAALAIATLIAAASVTAPAATSMVGAMLLSLALLAVIWLRLPACVGSFDAPALPVRSLEAAELPVYSVAIALYREARVVPQLLAALNKIDYPRAKLDFKFVIEEDDEETLAALADARHLSSFEIIVAPAGMPRTKPRALNVALPLMRGQFVTVFDAEDAPDPGQIKMAAQCFAAAPPRLACLQRYVGANAGRRAPEGWRAI